MTKNTLVMLFWPKALPAYLIRSQTYSKLQIYFTSLAGAKLPERDIRVQITD